MYFGSHQVIEGKQFDLTLRKLSLQIFYREKTGLVKSGESLNIKFLIFRARFEEWEGLTPNCVAESRLI